MLVSIHKIHNQNNNLHNDKSNYNLILYFLLIGLKTVETSGLCKYNNRKGLLHLHRNVPDIYKFTCKNRYCLRKCSNFTHKRAAKRMGRTERARGDEQFYNSLILTRWPVSIRFQIHFFKLSCLFEASRRETPAGRWVKWYKGDFILTPCSFTHGWSTRVRETFKKCYLFGVIWR